MSYRNRVQKWHTLTSITLTMVAGDPGTGKSRAIIDAIFKARGGEGGEEIGPVLYIDLENGVPDYKDRMTEDDGYIGDVKSIGDLNNILSEIENEIATGNCPWMYLVLDPIDTLYIRHQEDIAKKVGRGKAFEDVRLNWAKVKSPFKLALTKVMNLPGMHVFFVSHGKMRTDNQGNITGWRENMEADWGKRARASLQLIRQPNGKVLTRVIKDSSGILTPGDYPGYPNLLPLIYRPLPKSVQKLKMQANYAAWLSHPLLNNVNAAKKKAFTSLAGLRELDVRADRDQLLGEIDRLKIDYRLNLETKEGLALLLTHLDVSPSEE